VEQLDVRILGPLEVVSGGSRVGLGGYKQRAVLAILATRAGTAVSSDQLIELLWDSSPPASAATTVQVYVSRLRKLLGAGRIETSGGGYVLRVEPDQLDAARFRRLVSQGRSFDALALWRGPALADFVYEAWSQAEAGRLEEERLACLEQRIDADLEAGRHAALVGELEALVAEHPLRERFRGQLMLALYRAGRQADALDAYQRARSVLVEELGIEPGPELQELNRRILQQDVSSPSRRRQLPTGTVTLLATDIEGSTRLLAELGSEAYAEALAEHRRVLREAFAAHAGVEVDTQGDAFLIAFARAGDAAAAAEEAHGALADGPVRVRIGLHSGEPLLTDEGYVGIDVHQAARIMSAGHGGQTLVSETTAALLGPEVVLCDLGAHRLKDLTAAQRLYQLGDGEFSRLKALHETNLPVQPTPLVGRAQELAGVLELLSVSRLVTLTGAGGSGKTRLALQAAAELVNDFEEGVWWVSLAALREPELVETKIAQVVGARDGLAEHLRGRKALLLLDNFEHLLAAAPRIAALLSEAPEVCVLATSRERLGIAAEQEYAVPTLVSAEAVALLTARARQLKPGFEPNDDVVEICRRLDGLPLAIELAAARMKVLAPDQLLDRLGHSLDLLTAGNRDAPARQQTLRATIEWSHELLDADEQQLFARLAVFAGSFSLEAAEAVCAADIDPVAALADKSLLRWTDKSRFFMLETIHEYALERLEASGAAPALRRRHTEYFLGRADQFAAASAAGQSEALVRLGDEYAEHRAALGFLQQSGDYERFARLAVSLRRFWELRGYLREGLSWLEAAAAAAADGPKPLHASALQAAAILACRLGQLRQADELSEAAYELSQAMGDVDGRMLALNTRALAAVGAHDYDRARAFSEEQATLAREHGQERPLGAALDNLSYVARARGDHEEAIRLSEEALEIFRRVSDSYSVGVCLVNLGASLVEQHEVRDARVFLEEAIGLFVGLEHWEGVAAGLVACAAAAEEREAHEASASLLAAADSLLTDVGASGIDGGLRQRTLDKTRRGLDDRSFEAAWAHGSLMEVGDAVEFAVAAID
jgi:predicted ATPase/DNA-binding SARP family transcriptional activator